MKHFLLPLFAAAVCSVSYSQKITVSGSQVTAESGAENGSKLFDEQTLAGDPKTSAGGACATNWVPGWSGLPHHAYVDLGQSHDLTDIYLYDLNGTSTFTVSTGTPGNWTLLFTDNMAGYQVWNAHPVAVNTRYIRFSSPDGDCRAYEVVLYGAPASGGPDVTAPAAITNLSAGTPAATAVPLNWTAPGDDGSVGTATTYDVRYSTTPILTGSDFNNAIQASNEPTPKFAGSSESFTVTGLTANTLYYFAIVTADEVPNFSALSNTVSATTSPASGGLPPLTKTYIHLPSLDPQWNTTATYNALEATDFDTHWALLLNSLPAADGSWNGGNLNLGSNGTGYGVVQWNGASSSAKKPILVQLPSAGAAPSVGICPMNNNFIVCSAFNNSTGTISGPADYTTALLSIQQMIRNILASGNATADVFVIGKSQGGGTGMMTAGLNASVKDVFLSVPALAGYTGTSGTTGAYPGYAPTNANGYIDAVNHAKRYRNKATFSVSYDDNVTWGRGQVTCARNTQFTTTVYHGNDGHNDPDWWTLGTAWLDSCLKNVVDNGVGLAGSATFVNEPENTMNDISVFPNPFVESTLLTIDAPVSKTELLLSITDISGRVLKQIGFSGNQIVINRDEMVPGMYFYTLRSVDDFVGSGKLLVK